MPVESSGFATDWAGSSMTVHDIGPGGRCGKSHAGLTASMGLR